MKPLLLGSTGYIGQKFAQKINCVKMKHQDVSVRNLLRLWVQTSFDTIINCAGVVGRPNVDAVEKRKEDAVNGNVVLPAILAQFANLQKDMKILHVSTGCCYESNQGQVFTEDDEPNLDWNGKQTCSFYSGSKSLAEKWIQSYEKHYICRLRMPFDHQDGERNYLSKLMQYNKLLSSSNSLSHREDFVNCCLKLLEVKANYGTYNVVNTGFINAKVICNYINSYTNIKKDFKFFEDLEEFYFETKSAPRSNCMLSNKKLLDAGVNIRNVDEAIIDSLKNWS